MTPPTFDLEYRSSIILPSNLVFSFLKFDLDGDNDYFPNHINKQKSQIVVSKERANSKHTLWSRKS